jgi:hypothetical protein
MDRFMVSFKAYASNLSGKTAKTTQHPSRECSVRGTRIRNV